MIGVDAVIDLLLFRRGTVGLHSNAMTFVARDLYSAHGHGSHSSRSCGV